MTTLIDAGRVVTFAAERLTRGLWDEAQPLLEAHYQEVAYYPDIPLDPDIRAYSAAVDQGIVHVFTARSPDGRLIGYALFFVKPNPHYRDSLQAVQDVLFVDKRYRGLTGYRFMKFCDNELQGWGVEVVYQHMKVAKDHERTLRKLGYEPIDQIWGKRLSVTPR